MKPFSKKKEEIFLRFSSLLIMLVFFTISLIVTAPLVFNFQNHVIGHQYTDTLAIVWEFSWIKKSILEGMNVFYTEYRCYPPGGKFYPITLFSAALSIPFQLIFNLTIAYNIIVLFLLTMAAYTSYYLIKYLTGSKIAGFIGGIIYGYCPSQLSFIHNGTVHLLNNAWIPLFAFYLFKSVREEKYTKNTFMAVILLFIIAFSSWYMGLFSSMFMGLLFIYYLLFKRKTKQYKSNRILKKFILIFLSFIILISPFAFCLIQNAFEGDNNVIESRWPEITLDKMEIAEFSNLVDYFKPTLFYTRPNLQIDNNLAENKLPYHRTIFSYGVYLGYLALLLAFIGSILKDKRKETRFWVYSGIFFFIISLGPYLHLNGQEAVKIAGNKVALPYLLFFKFFPFFWRMYCPTRFVIMVYLSLAVLSGFAVNNILAKFKKRQRYAIAAFISMSILLEYSLFSLVPYPLPLTCTDVSDYYHLLAKEKGNFAILELPMGNIDFFVGKNAYAQAIHGKKITHSIAIPWPHQYPYIVNKNKFAEYLAYLDGSLSGPINISAVDLKQGLKELKNYGFKYVIVHNNLFGEISAKEVHKFLKLSLGEPSKYEDNIIVYEVQ